MECVVLGNGGMMPTPLRMTASVLVRREGRMLMFDAGEGIQISLKRTGFGICSLDAIVVSHLHADHVLGIPGILMYRAQCDAAGPLTIVGPPGIRRFVQHTIEDLGYYLNYEVRYVEWPGAATAAAASAAPGLAPSGESKSKAAANMQPLWSWNGHVVRAAPLTHSTFCLGFRLEEASRPGRFDVDRARALGVPVGPLCGRLQAGESVQLSDGRVIQPTEVLGPERRGRVLAYATDSRPCVALEDLCRGANLRVRRVDVRPRARRGRRGETSHDHGRGSVVRRARRRSPPGPAAPEPALHEGRRSAPRARSDELFRSGPVGS